MAAPPPGAPGPGAPPAPAAPAAPLPLMNEKDFSHLCNMQYQTAQFQAYRTVGGVFNPGDYSHVQNQPVPMKVRARGDRPKIFQTNLQPWVKNPLYGNDDNLPLSTFESASDFPPDWDHERHAWKRLQRIKNFFDGTPRYDYQKLLGIGGNGLCGHFRFDGTDPPPGLPRDIALKIAIRGWRDTTLREEKEAMSKYARASHILQAIPQEKLGKKARRAVVEQRSDDDSSDEGGDSSGDEDVEVPQRPRKRRKALTKAEREAKAKNWDRGSASETDEDDSDPGDDEKDYIVTELFANGDLFSLIAKSNELNKPMPDKLLWSFWLCLIKQCIAMAFPPRKFHPDRKTQQTGELDEIIPDIRHHWRAKRMVHFDIDPQNVFVADVDPTFPQHSVVPKLKLGDFGLADEIKSQKRDCYYVNRRGSAKHAYFAPEQFGEEWDFIPVERNGDNICDEPIAGNYGIHTNIWGIALTMFAAITGCNPPQPPQPDYLMLANGARVVSYGMGLWDALFTSYDVDLRTIVARCMCHDPLQRPGLRELLQSAEAGLAKPYAPGEDVLVENWVFDMVNSAPTA